MIHRRGRGLRWRPQISAAVAEALRSETKKNPHRTTTTTRRRARRNTNRPDPSLITQQDGVDIINKRVVPHEDCFKADGGAAGFERVVAYRPPDGSRNPYYLPKSEFEIIANNPIITKDRHLLVFGGGAGHKEAEQSKLNGTPRHVTNIDLSREYHPIFSSNISREGNVSKRAITSLTEDFMYFGPGALESGSLWIGSDSMWADENWNAIRHDGTPLTVTVYGHTLCNSALPEITKFLMNLRAKMRPGECNDGIYTGDIAYISMDSTVNHELLNKAYNIPPFTPWFKQVFGYIFTRILKLSNLKRELITYKADVSQEGDLHVVRGYLDVDEKHPDLSWENAKDFLRHFTREVSDRFIQSIKKFPDTRYEMLPSYRIPEWRLRKLFDDCGLELHKRPGEREGQPLRAPVRSYWRQQGVNNNIWALVPKAAAA